MEYQYPLDLDWTNDEMMKVIHFFNKIENYYEASVKGDEVLNAYNSYKVVQEIKKNPNQTLFSKDFD